MRLPRLRRRLVVPGVIGGVAALLVGAGAAAAFEADTVSSYWDGLWWALGLMTTVGFVGGPPHTTAGCRTGTSARPGRTGGRPEGETSVPRVGQSLGQGLGWVPS